jgi:hypothetical protein
MDIPVHRRAVIHRPPRGCTERLARRRSTGRRAAALAARRASHRRPCTPRASALRRPGAARRPLDAPTCAASLYGRHPRSQAPASISARRADRDASRRTATRSTCRRLVTRMRDLHVSPGLRRASRPSRHRAAPTILRRDGGGQARSLPHAGAFYPSDAVPARAMARRAVATREMAGAGDRLLDTPRRCTRTWCEARVQSSGVPESKGRSTAPMPFR